VGEQEEEEEELLLLEGDVTEEEVADVTPVSIQISC
jgi:hypothetical protein